MLNMLPNCQAQLHHLSSGSLAISQPVNRRLTTLQQGSIIGLASVSRHVRNRTSLDEKQILKCLSPKKGRARVRSKSPAVDYRTVTHSGRRGSMLSSPIPVPGRRKVLTLCSGKLPGLWGYETGSGHASPGPTSIRFQPIRNRLPQGIRKAGRYPPERGVVLYRQPYHREHRCVV
jgi:hypothetical protein